MQGWRKRSPSVRSLPTVAVCLALLDMLAFLPYVHRGEPVMTGDSGQGLIEYILIIILIIVMGMIIWALLGPTIEEIISNVINSI